MIIKKKVRVPAQIALALMFGTASAPGVALADLVCHCTKNGVKMLDVPAKSVQAHLRHGDYLPYRLYMDNDGDGFGDPETMIPSCIIGPGTYVDNGDDPDDNTYGTGGYEEDPGEGDDNGEGYEGETGEEEAGEEEA